MIVKVCSLEEAQKLQVGETYLYGIPENYFVSDLESKTFVILESKTFVIEEISSSIIIGEWYVPRQWLTIGKE